MRRRARRDGDDARMGPAEEAATRRAKLVCIDIQPYGTTQAKSRPDIINVGGFSDAVFDDDRALRLRRERARLGRRSEGNGGVRAISSRGEWHRPGLDIAATRKSGPWRAPRPAMKIAANAGRTTSIANRQVAGSSPAGSIMAARSSVGRAGTSFQNSSPRTRSNAEASANAGGTTSCHDEPFESRPSRKRIGGADRSWEASAQAGRRFESAPGNR